MVNLFVILDKIRQDKFCPMVDINSIGSSIRILRKKEQMPLRRLAALLNIDQSTLSKIERDERKANVTLIVQISHIFKVDKSKLLKAFYSDIVAADLCKETNFSQILQVAQAKIEHRRNKLRQIK